MAGRGGAGNILALQQQTERIAQDVEANRKPVVLDEPGTVSGAAREEQQYAYTGRGGAGNYYVPKELEQTGHFSNAHRSHILGDGTLAPGGNDKDAKVTPARWQGRGGAGNFAWDVVQDEERAAQKKLEADREKEAKLKAEVERGVEASIAMPEKAKLSNDLV